MLPVYRHTGSAAFHSPHRRRVLLEAEAPDAAFRVLPRLRVHSEGEKARLLNHCPSRLTPVSDIRPHT